VIAKAVTDSWFKMKNYLQRLLIKFVSKASFIIGELHLPFNRKLITGDDYRSLMAVIQEGDILLSLTHGELAVIFIPGHFAHVAIYKYDRKVIEAVTHGVHITDIFDFFLNKDQIVVLRPKFASPEEIKKVITYCEAQIGKPYNFDLKFSELDEKHYCCELIYKGYNKAVLNSPFKLRNTLGIDTVVPDDFLNANKKWAVIWESKSYKDRK
jgi:uncharacterized protein YycO